MRFRLCVLFRASERIFAFLCRVMMTNLCQSTELTLYAYTVVYISKVLGAFLIFFCKIFGVLYAYHYGTPLSNHGCRSGHQDTSRSPHDRVQTEQKVTAKQNQPLYRLIYRPIRRFAISSHVKNILIIDLHWPPFCLMKLTTCCWPVCCKAVRNLTHWSSDVRRSSTASFRSYAALSPVRTLLYCLRVSTSRLSSSSISPKSGSIKSESGYFSLVMEANTWLWGPWSVNVTWH